VSDSEDSDGIQRIRKWPGAQWYAKEYEVVRLVVCGYMIRYPMAGMLMAYFQYVLGLLRLGHEVLYLEESGWPVSCYNPLTHTCSNDPSYGIENLRHIMSKLGVTFPLFYVDRESGRTEGIDWLDAKRMLSQADLLLNLGGVCWLPEFHLCRRRALIDMDPFFTQIGKMGVEGLKEYDVYFSYGANIGRAGCTIPTNGIQWWPTVPPVVPDLWSCRRTGEEISGNHSSRAAFTTIANWTAYGEATYQGESYGQKDREFLGLLTLPSRVGQRLELALSGADTETIEKLGRAGWSVREALKVSRDLPGYRQYIAGSRGEFSTAKHGYVKTHSGWFSDRSVCYLACGRPVILQDSGFSDWLPTGRGVLAFTSLKEAVQCIERVNADYTAHCRAASAIAEDTFSYRKVLPRVLEIGMVARPTQFDERGV
jgi:hypothetical protein